MSIEEALREGEAMGATPREPETMLLLGESGNPVVHALIQTGVLRQQPKPPKDHELLDCSICEQATRVATPIEAVTGLVCSSCSRAYTELTEAFEKGLERHRSDFRSQLRQMIKDRRSGAELPTFYRGSDA